MAARAIGIFIAERRDVAVTASTPERILVLRERIADLSQRWLPMLLHRAGVNHELTMRLRRELDDHQELHRRLELARRAVRVAGRSADHEAAGWARSSGEVISSLIRANELVDYEPAAAERIIARANERVFSLVVGAPSTTDSLGWWSRLFSSRVAQKTA